MGEVREQLEREAKDFGITIVDVRIRRADLPEQNSQAVYQRMQTERQQEAAQFRAQGSQRAQEIRAKADREVTELLADATATGEATRGEGDAERNRIFAEAFGRDPDFFAFYRAMQAYEAGLPAERHPHGAAARFGFLPLLRRSERQAAARSANDGRTTPAGGAGDTRSRNDVLAARMRSRRHVRFHRRHRPGARDRGIDLRGLSGGRKAAGGERAGNA